jgi:hypothetical protein
MKGAPRGKGRTRRVPGEMNGLERAYQAVLEQRRIAGEVYRYAYESVNLRLADRTFYRPDFWVVLADGAIELHEVKGGHWEEQAKVRTKVAAALFPELRFVVATRALKRDGGGWSYREVGEGELTGKLPDATEDAIDELERAGA